MTYIILNAGIIAVIWYGGFEVYDGIITQGEVIALINYMSQILLALIAFSNLIISFTRASASAVRINEVFAVKSSMNEASSKVNEYAEANSPKVEFRDVSFSYNQSEEEALSGISFRVESGETVGIIGGTGSGKSTLVNLIPRFYDVTYGEILIDGKNVKDYAFPSSGRKLLWYQKQFFSGTRQNMQWGKRRRNRRGDIQGS